VPIDADRRRLVVPAAEWDAIGAELLRERIVQAFPAELLGTAGELTEDARETEAMAIRTMASGRDWRGIPATELRYNRFMANWVSDAGFAALLPAYLFGSLAASESDLRAATVRDLTPYDDRTLDRLRRRKSRLDFARRTVVADWLAFVFSQEEHGMDALDFWSRDAQGS